MELRIALTVLPVGPRGTDVLEANADLWFAVQISAGFREAHDPAAIDRLWPWVLHVVDNGLVKMRCFLIDGAGAATHTDRDAAVPPDDDFSRDLRQKIVTIYSDAALRQTLDMRLLLPAEVSAVSQSDKETHERASFPSRVQYLATLPGELARRLLATLYVKVPRGDLFTKSSGTWAAKGVSLWIAPVFVNGSTKIELTGDPVTTGNFHTLTKMDNGTDIVAIGPGFDLSRCLAPAQGVFRLDTYDVPVQSGDRRFVEMESLLLNILDPFAELHEVRRGDARDKITLKDSAAGKERVIAEEAFDALTDAWRVRAFADSLRAVFPDGLEELLTLVLPQNEPRPALTIPDRWNATLAADLAETRLKLADRLATRIGVAHAEDRATLRRVSQYAGFAAIARLLAQAFDDVLNATAAATKPLRDAWSFGGAFTAAQLSERRATVALAAIGHLRERKEVALLLPDLRDAALNTDSEKTLRDAVAATLKSRWPARAGAEFIGVLDDLGLATGGEQIVFAADLAMNFAAGYVDALWPAPDAVAIAELPGRGLSLRLGEPAHRLVHEDNHDADATGSPYREVAGVLLLARRGITDTDMHNREWRILTAGAAMIGEIGDRLFVPEDIVAKEWLHDLLPLPLRPVFQQKVARADIEYHGQPMLAQSALDHAYAAGDYVTEDPEGLDAAYSFHPVGSFEQEMHDAAKASRSPALRYGDHYEFRAGVIDQAGGLPGGIAGATEPWRIDIGKLVNPAVAGFPVHYLRTIPPGDVNILPGDGANPTVKYAWPALPDDVALRAREFRAVDHTDADSLPAVLLRSSRFANQLPEYRFRIAAPVIDEHTLMRWAVPALDDADPATAVANLKTALAGLFEQRGSEGAAVQLHDPAVASLGIRIRAAGSDNRVIEIFRTALAPVPIPNEPFQRRPIPVHLLAAPSGTAPQASGDQTGVEVVLPEGSFAVIEVFPLVTDSDYRSRFIPFKEMTDDSIPFPGFIAFHPSVILAESATDTLPTEVQLYDHLALVEQNGQIAIRFDGSAFDELVFVDRFAIERDRWVWRNLPVVTMSSLQPGNNIPPATRTRLLASGPPEAVFDLGKRDTDDGVKEWERIASIDRGFADRGEIAGRWPRLAAVAPFAGGPGMNVLLASDNRDGVTAADYLRFGLRVRSRYAGVLAEKSREKPESKGKARRRRIVTGFRGQKVKPPKILAIVPLTASLDSAPLNRPAGVTPFLVLLDETFFREYGTGERIEMHLALENLDIGEKPDAVLPYRTGALPDHWLRLRPADANPPYFRGKQVTTEKDAADPITLDLFGPFGYSLDLTPSEALANASAFVAYPPADAGAHWAMFVRLRRLLDKPSNGQVSEFSDVHALYTLPDTHLLAAGSNAVLELTQTTAALRNLSLLLDPTAKPEDAAIAPRKNSEASSQYRYFLLVSRVVAGAGQAFDAELPAGLWRIPLFDPALGYQTPGKYVVELRPGTENIPVTALTQDIGIAIAASDGAEYRGRILEIMINGRYDKASRLDNVKRWTEFWTSLLEHAADDETDAAGMIRRVSRAFSVVVQ